MSAKEIRTECPSCRSRLVVDVRTERVVRWDSARAAAPGERDRSRDDDWARAVERAGQREGRGRDRFEAALAKEGGRERDLDVLFDRAATRAEGRDRDFPVARSTAGTEGPRAAESGADAADFSETWARRLSRAEFAALAARARGAGGDVIEFGSARAVLGDGIAELFDVDLASGEDLHRALATHAFATVRTLEGGRSAEVFAGLLARGWVPSELDAVFFRDLEGDVPRCPRTTREAQAGDLESWSRIVSRAQGVPDAERETHVRRLAAQFGGEGWRLFLARDGDEDVGATALRVEDGVAVLSVAATLPDHRGRGHDFDGIVTRLHAAREAGADVAITVPGLRCPSRAATVRAGFRLAFHQLLWVPRTDA